MAFQQVEAILRHTRELRNRVCDAVRSARQAEPDPIAKELMQRIEQHDYRMQQFLSGHARSAPQEVLDTWVQFSDTKQIEQEIDALGFDKKSRNPPPRAVIDKALELDHRIMDLYRSAKEQVSAPSVKDFFEKLLMMEEQQARSKSRNAVETQDLKRI